MELLLPVSNNNIAWLNHDKDPVYILPYSNISTFTTKDHETWFLPGELRSEEHADDGGDNDDGCDDDDDIQMDDTDNDDIPFEAKDHYDHPI
ncbi:unnamed protein product [Lactuca virosa]|uniref:Uncharacterized protein n=1 Tax=Lactuca virosa TaxID=75947 RepID=A0AAU9LNC5_9ASTR|nr:unnamed protein product [Lactuca virosa]